VEGKDHRCLAGYWESSDHKPSHYHQKEPAIYVRGEKSVQSGKGGHCCQRKNNLPETAQMLKRQPTHRGETAASLKCLVSFACNHQSWQTWLAVSPSHKLDIRLSG
jgi:hypothetical protein